MAQIGLLEDNVRIAKLCTTLLNYAGHQVTVYEHPQKCLYALLPELEPLHVAIPSHTLPVEVLILDLILPDINGIEVLRQLQAHPSTRRLPLILCTGASDGELFRALSIAPQASIVEKPFKLQSLISAITTSLSTVSK